jgi:hypothetical protein
LAIELVAPRDIQRSGRVGNTTSDHGLGHGAREPLAPNGRLLFVLFPFLATTALGCCSQELAEWVPISPESQYKTKKIIVLEYR